MISICEKYSHKIDKEINSLLFLYGGNQINFNLKLKEQAYYQDLTENKINLFVYEKEIFTYPKCKQKNQSNTQKFEQIISSNNGIIDSINGIQFQIDNIINIETSNQINSQLKNINKMLNMVNQDIKNNEEKINYLFNDYNNKNISIDNKNNINNDKKHVNNNSIKNIKSND